ncbi:MAG: flagellar FliJ protein [Paraglaciecola sp.]|jgi:flagellar FliJ protein
MATDQLEQVADWERQKEQKLVQNFQLAQRYAQENKQKLSGLEQYRLDYLLQAHNKAQQGVGAQSYGQHQLFIGKLDKACEQQSKVLSNGQLVVDQRRDQWLQQQRKRKAVEMLLDKKYQKVQKKADKLEQQMLDEISLQKFIRS